MIRNKLKKDPSIADLYEAVVGMHNELRDDIHKRFDKVDQRFDETDQRFDEVDQRLETIEASVRGIRRDLDRLTERVEDIAGFSKEIDELRTRLVVIEKHLGITATAA